MIDHARVSIAHIDERLARLDAERASLQLLRDGWEHYLALTDGLVAVIDAPEQAAGPSVSEPAPATAPAAVSLPPGDGSPATQLPDDPGAAGPRAGEEDGGSGRTPAAQAETAPQPVRPALTAPEPAIQQPGSARADGAGTARPVGTPTPAPRSTTGRVVDPAKGWIRCPECGERVRAQGLGAHRSRSKAHAAAVSATLHYTGRQAAPSGNPERNPRTTPPLGLPPRSDQAVGE